VTFVVDVPPNRESERRYILDVVLGDWLGLSWRMRVQERRDVRISAGDGVNERCLTMPDVLFDACGPAWLSMASLPSTPLATVSVPGGSPIAGSAARSGADRRVPVVFGRTGARAAPPSPGLHLDVDVLGSAFFMLTRYEEAVLRERDRFDRFPAAASLAARAGFLEVPVVDAYVELLWEALRRLWPGLRRRARQPVGLRWLLQGHGPTGPRGADLVAAHGDRHDIGELLAALASQLPCRRGGVRRRR